MKRPVIGSTLVSISRPDSHFILTRKGAQKLSPAMCSCNTRSVRVFLFHKCTEDLPPIVALFLRGKVYVNYRDLPPLFESEDHVQVVFLLKYDLMIQ
jgi:hypothetical protein